jgi:hypothetical protein
MGALALFLVIAGGTAYAADTIGSSDIIDGQVKSADIGNNQVQSVDVRDDTLANGGLGSADIQNGALGTSDIHDESLGGIDIADDTITHFDVANEDLTGADIANQSGVDTCTHGTARFGELCVGVANQHNTWISAGILCGNLELRLPSLGEAVSLATNYDLPSVDEREYFWTDETLGSGPIFQVWIVYDEAGGFTFDDVTASHETVCVTTPTN